jgi:predicted PurR-regulated permease PerM
VVVAISTGGVLAGIVGALLSVPTVAFFNNAFQVLLAKDPEAAAEEAEDDEGSIMQVEPDELESKSS